MHDYERVIASSAMKMSHQVYRRLDGKEKLCEVYSFDSLGSFLYFDFFRGLSQSYIPKRGDHCGKYFLLEAGKYSSYCERLLQDDPSRSCRDVGARKKYDDKCKTDPVWLAYNRAYKAHYARYMKKKMTVLNLRNGHGRQFNGDPGRGREAGTGCVPADAEKIKQRAERSSEHPARFLLCFQRRKFHVFCRACIRCQLLIG